jgi:hypothetical protein
MIGRACSTVVEEEIGYKIVVRKLPLERRKWLKDNIQMHAL